MEWRRLLIGSMLIGVCLQPSAQEHRAFSEIKVIHADGNFLQDYAKDLALLGLEPLGIPENAERYRFEIVPAFSRPVLFELLVLPDGTANATAYTVQWDSEPASPQPPIHKQLTKRQVREFKYLLEEAEFWSRYYFGWGTGLDTQEWIFEGARKNEYQIFSTSDPAPVRLQEAGSLLFRTMIGNDIPR